MATVLISIVIPVVGEAENMTTVLDQLSGQSGDFEVLIVSNSSTIPNELELVAPDGLASAINEVRLIPVSDGGYEVCLNAGAAAAKGQVLLFLDPHNQLPAQALEAIERNLKLLPRTVGGNFHLKFKESSLLINFLGRTLKRWRYRGCYYNGSGLFVRREVYFSLGGIKTDSVLPDYDFVQRMEKYGPTLYLPQIIRLPAPSFRVGLIWMLTPLLVHFGPTRFLLKIIRPGPTGPRVLNN